MRINGKSNGVTVSINFTQETIIDLLWEQNIPTTSDNIFKFELALNAKGKEIADNVIATILNKEENNVIKNLIIETFGR